MKSLKWQIIDEDKRNIDLHLMGKAWHSRLWGKWKYRMYCNSLVDQSREKIRNLIANYSDRSNPKINCIIAKYNNGCACMPLCPTTEGMVKGNPECVVRRIAQATPPVQSKLVMLDDGRTQWVDIKADGYIDADKAQPADAVWATSLPPRGYNAIH